MGGTLADTDDQLLLQAGIAKRGARDVLLRLQNLVNVGAPSIAEISYAIRIREKEDYKIVEKVLFKRQKDPKYAVDRLRDIVGLRVVTLYRLDALDVIPRLIEFIRSGSGNKDSLFLSPDIEEIKIYSTNPKGDAQALPQRLVGLFDSLGYEGKAEIVERPENYSSIHMVTWCRGRYGDTYCNVPLEIQVRTALEDAWGEIDHKLKYKRATQKLSVRDETILQVCLAHLGVMKTFIDGAAQYADQIRVQADQATARRFVSTTHRIIQDTTFVIRTMELPPHVRTQIEHALEHQTEAMHPTRKSREYAEARIGSLRNALRELEAAIDLVTNNVHSENANRDLLLRFYLPLEVALCRFQLGVELRADKKILAEAVLLYQSVQDDFPNRAIVRYRYGRTLAALGDFPAAIKKMEEADELLSTKKDDTIEKNHWLRLSVPRNLGAYVWALGETLKTDGVVSEEDRPKLLELLVQAYKTTKAAYGMRVDADALSDQFDVRTGYRGRVANNLLFYLDDYLSLGGSEENLKPHGFKEDEVAAYLQLLEQNFDLIDSPPTLHTMLRHYLKLGAAAQIPTTARKLRKILRERGVVDAGGKSQDEQMLRLANSVLGDEP